LAGFTDAGIRLSLRLSVFPTALEIAHDAVGVAEQSATPR